MEYKEYNERTAGDVASLMAGECLRRIQGLKAETIALGPVERDGTGGEGPLAAP